MENIAVIYKPSCSDLVQSYVCLTAAMLKMKANSNGGWFGLGFLFTFGGGRDKVLKKLEFCADFRQVWQSIVQ